MRSKSNWFLPFNYSGSTSHPIQIPDNKTVNTTPFCAFELYMQHHKSLPHSFVFIWLIHPLLKVFPNMLRHEYASLEMCLFVNLCFLYMFGKTFKELVLSVRSANPCLFEKSTGESWTEAGPALWFSKTSKMFLSIDTFHWVILIREAHLDAFRFSNQQK